MLTGELIETAGVYLATCDGGHSHEILLAKGEPFPPCGQPLFGGQARTECTIACSYEFVRHEPPVIDAVLEKDPSIDL